MKNKKYRVLKNSKNKSWITFIHGFTHDNEYFLDQAEIFKNKYNVLLINLLGHGERYKDKGPFSLNNYVLDIINILKELEINKTIFWGSHTGAACGLLIACDYPSFIECLILEGTPVPGIDIPSINRNFNSTREIYLKEGIKKSIDHWFYNSEWFSYMHLNSKKEIIERQYAMLKRFKGRHFDYVNNNMSIDLTSKIRDIRIPCLLYNGEFDVEDFKDATKQISYINELFTTKIIENTGGFPSWEDYTKVNSIVDKFLINNKLETGEE